MHAEPPEGHEPARDQADREPAADHPEGPPAVAGHLSWRAAGEGMWRCVEAATSSPRLLRSPAPGERAGRWGEPAVGDQGGVPWRRPSHARLVPGRPLTDGRGRVWVVHDDPGGRPAPPAAGHGPAARPGVGALTAAALADVARALAALHRAGQAHGAVGDPLVWVAADGGGWLLDTVGGQGTEAADVEGLAALVARVPGLGGPPAGASPQPTTAEDWARWLRAGVPESPVSGLRARARDQPERSASRLSRLRGQGRRWGWAAAGAGALVAGSGLWQVGVAEAPVGAAPAAVEQPATRSPSPEPAASVRAEPDWRAVLAALDSARAQALAAADPLSLRAVVAPGSPAAAAEGDRLEALAASGLRVTGLRRDLVSVLRTPPPTGADDAEAVWLRVVDRLSGHQLVDDAGAVVEQRAGRGEAAWWVTLRPVGAGWRIADVVPA